MYETLMRREEQLNETRYNDTRLNRGAEYPNPYVSQADFANTYRNNYLPAAPFQNDVYTSNVSDNINMNVSEYDMYNVAQQANMYAQTPVYQQTYDYQLNAYNNVRAQAETRPTQYYQPQQTYHNMFRPVQQNQEETLVDYKAPTNKKAKNKMAVALIAVYFMIIAVCAVLILVNVFAASSSATVNAVSATVQQESVITSAVTQDGSIVDVQTTPAVIEYSYDTSTNWFDKLCDKIGSKLG